MRQVFHPLLPNGLFGDPLLWIDVPDHGHSVLFDLGDLHGVPNRKLLRVGRAVVTHTHMDHFIGFDHLLRVALGRRRRIVLTGPDGFLENVRGKLGAYTWNLIGDYPVDLIAEELAGDVIRGERYAGCNGLRPEALPERPFDGVIHNDETYRIEVASFDHGIPVLGVALHEHEHLAINKDRLERLGLQAGPWLNELKQHVRRGTCDGETMELAERLVLRQPGQKIVYLTDLRSTDENLQQAEDLARGAHLLVCECAFSHDDAEIARRKNHLTARQAGALARAAGVGKLAPFHLSPRYEHDEARLLAEAREAFGGPVVRLPTGPEIT